MSRTTPLDTLIDLTRDARDQAGQRLAGERGKEQQVAAQLDSLVAYRREYADSLADSMSRGIDPATLHNTQRFLASLDAALDRARQALDGQRQRVSQSQQQWQGEQQRLNAYDTLSSRRAAEGAVKAARQEQRTIDDMVNSRLQRASALPEGL